MLNWFNNLTFLYVHVHVGTIIEVQQHIIAAKPIKTTDKQAPVTATECTASTSQVEPTTTEAGSPAPQVVEPLTSESDTPSPHERVDTTPNVEESDNSISPTKTSLHKSSWISQISRKQVHSYFQHSYMCSPTHNMLWKFYSYRQLCKQHSPDPMLLEMEVEELKQKIQVLEEGQQTILAVLESIQKMNSFLL